jgi:Uma2 family endonuclease
VGDDRYAPDVAFVAYETQAELARDGYNPIPPDLAVEVLSPTDDPRLVRLKIAGYLSAGTVVWVVDRDARTVEVYLPGETPRLLTQTATLDGGQLLPGFSLPVEQLFPPDKSTS